MKKIALVAICVLLASGCGISVADRELPTDCDWTSSRGNGQNTGSVLSGCSPSLDQLTKKWQFPAKGAVIQTPVSQDGKVFIGTIGKKFYCIEIKTGTLVWEYEADVEIVTPAVIASGKVMFGTKTPSLVCLDVKTGNELWIFDTDGQLSTPNADNDQVYFGTSSKTLSALKIEDGSEVWSVQLEGGIKGCPAFFESNLIIGCFDGMIHQIDRKTGRIYDITKSTGPVTTSIAVSGSCIVYASYEGRIHSFDIHANKEKWTFNVGTNQEGSPTIWRDKVFFGANDGYFYCLNLEHGTKNWIYDTGLMRRIVGSSTVSNGMVWFPSEDNYLYCLDAISGDKLWSYKTSDRIWSSPIITNQHVIVGCNDANIYCFGE
jgi:outer membrane protein assembly factor BamB